MVSKILSYLLAIIVLFLIIGIGIQYYITLPTEPERLVCHKGRLLAQVEGEGTVYTRIKKFSCEFDKGMLIIEEQS
jgi:nitric oxide reductase large subunit